LRDVLREERRARARDDDRREHERRGDGGGVPAQAPPASRRLPSGTTAAGWSRRALASWATSAEATAAEYDPKKVMGTRPKTR
jgi:hypothetical protein